MSVFSPTQTSVFRPYEGRFSGYQRVGFPALWLSYGRKTVPLALAVFSHKGGSVRKIPGVPALKARQRPARSVRILWRFCLYPAFPLSPKRDRKYTSCPSCPASRSSVRGWHGLTAAHRAALRYRTSPFSAENRDKGKTAALRCRL